MVGGDCFQETPRVDILMVVISIGRVFAFIPVGSTDIHVVSVVLVAQSGVCQTQVSTFIQQISLDHQF